MLVLFFLGVLKEVRLGSVGHGGGSRSGTG